MISELLTLVGYAFIGGAIKYVDQAYDMEVFSRKKANVVAVLVALLMAAFMIVDAYSLVIFFAVILVVAFTRKIDNIAFYAGTGIVLLLSFAAGSLGFTSADVLHLQWVSFGILLFSGMIDELGNDWADKRRKEKRRENLRNGFYDSLPLSFGEYFFEYRFTLKIALLALCFAGFFPFLYFFAFMLFDLSYIAVEWYSFRLKGYSIAPAKSSLRAHLATSLVSSPKD